MTKISIIVAMDNNKIIGNDNQLLWHLPNDLKHFKAITMGKPIVMGRKTFFAIGKPLPGRQNMILTKNHHLEIAECDMVHSVEEVLQKARFVPEIMIIGGAEIYRLFYSLATTLYMTIVDANLIGDTSFADYDEKDWKEIKSEQFSKDDKHAFAYRFVEFERA